MAKVRKHFTVTKNLPKNHGRLEISGIVSKDDPTDYDMEDIRFHTYRMGKPVTEDISCFFNALRDTTDSDYLHADICELLTEWLASDESKAIDKPGYSAVAVVGTHESLTGKSAA